jgi:hypothetical protein
MRHYRTPSPAQLTEENGSLILYSSYDPGLVSALKSQIPANERKFDGLRKAWVIAPHHGDLVAKMVLCYLNQNIMVPQIKVDNQPEIKILTIHYVGRTKDRPGYDVRTALGLDDQGDWSAVFPENVLLQWFTGMTDQASALTLYGVLGLSRSATPEEIKQSYRRLAKQWHPDVCTEPDAGEKFIRLKEAFEILGNENKRARYEAGLALEESLGRNYDFAPAMDGYKPMLRCGYILAEGIEKVGRFNVTKILNWEDITDPQGRTLVTSWPMGAREPDKRWV